MSNDLHINECHLESDPLYLKKQLLVARNEIHNLRQQIRALGNSHHQEVEKIQNALDLFKNNVCTCLNKAISSEIKEPPNVNPIGEVSVNLPYIGIISTWFPERKAIPRQPGICISSRGKIVLSNSVFTNPEHALEGLEGFSHMWVLFHFHKNDSTHVRAKVSPPRLNGVRTGVFGTRSPHRPSPIGLSLVTIDRIDGSCIHFSGVDMMDGTPVVDIKPYIPQYDNPIHCNGTASDHLDWKVDRGEPCDSSDDVDIPSCSSADPSPTQSSRDSIGEREAPDGEEGARLAPATPVVTLQQTVRVPDWVIRSPVPKLSVTFSDKSLSQLIEVHGDTEALKTAISCVLREDPRSVFLREKWGNQFYTFLIRDLHVSCKFDDSAHTVFVFQVKPAGKLCECGQPEWQCTIHGKMDE